MALELVCLPPQGRKEEASLRRGAGALHGGEGGGGTKPGMWVEGGSLRARGKGGGVKVVLVGTSKLETALEESSGCEMRIEREGERFIERERERCIERERERCTADERALNIEGD